MEELQKMSRVLTEEYLSERLSKWFQTDVKYTGYETHEGTGKGESYLSDVFRLTFQGKILSPKDGEKSEVSVKVIVKCLPRNISTRLTFRSVVFFRNEIMFYEKVLPKLLEFQAEKKLKEPFESCPKVFASMTNGKDDILALEDLSVHNYGSAVRQEGIDYRLIQKILETFAKFHAMSFAFKDQHPEEYETMAKSISETYYDFKFWEWYKGFWKNLCNCSIDAVSKEYPNTIYVKKIREFAMDKTFEKMVAAANDRGKSAVIGHGDSWTPNFLFTYKNQVPTDAMMIDFQLARCASPVLDIAFFIYACSDQKLRDEHYHDMLKYYYDILARQIRGMGSDPEKVYSWNEFMVEIKKYSYFGVGFSMESTPVIVLEPDEAFDMNNMPGTEPVRIETIWNVQSIKSKAGRQRMAGIIIHAVDNEYI